MIHFRSLLAPVLVFMAILPCAGGVLEGERTGSVNFQTSFGVGDLFRTFVHEDLDQPDGVDFENTVPLEGTFEGATVTALADVVMGNFARFERTTDSLTGLDRIVLRGGFYTAVEMSASGAGLDSSAFTGAFTSLAPGNDGWNAFSITDGPEVATFIVGIASASASGGPAELALQRWTGSDWEDVAVYASTSRYNAYRENLSLDPGDYRLYGSIAATANFDGDGSLSLDDSIGYEVRMGFEPFAVGYPAEEDYTHPLIGTDLVDSPKLQILNPAIVSEVDLGDGTTELTFTANLMSSSQCPWREVTVSLRAAGEGEPAVVSANRGVFFLEIDPLATIAPTDQGTVVVANEDLAAVREAILDGSRLMTSGRELIVFRYPVELVTEEMVAAQLDGSVELRFYEDRDGLPPGPRLLEPPVESGDILIEWEPYYAVPAREIPDGMGGIRWAQNFDKDLPMLVRSVNFDPGTIPAPADTWEISGDRLSMLDIVKHGSIRESAPMPLEGYTRNATEANEIDEQEFFPIPIYLHVNRFRLDDVLKVSGNFNFIPGEFSTEYEVEDGVPTTFLIRNQYTAEANLLLETVNHEEVGGSPLVDTQQTLFAVPLFRTDLPGGATFSAALDVEMGALANVTRSLSVPFVSRYTVEVAAGVKDGQPYYDFDTDLVPLKVSDPGVFDAVGADLDVWLNAELSASLSYLSGASASMTMGARLDGSFGLHPLADPWWDLGADLSLTSGFEFDLFLFLNLVDAEHELARYPLFAYDAGGPLISGLEARSLTLPPEGVNPGLRPLGDPSARWVRSVDPANRTAALVGFFLAEMEGTGDLLTGHSAGSVQRLLLFSEDGRLKRSLQSSNISHFIPIDAVALPGGGAVLLGTAAKEVQLVRVDNDLNILDQIAFDVDALIYQSLRLATDGTHVYVLGEFLADSQAQEVALTAIHLDTGAVAWSRSYEIAPEESLFASDLVLTADGGLVVAGTTTANFTTEEGLPEGDIVPNVSNNGFLAKVDAATGEVLWSTMIAHRGTSPFYNALAESPTGELTVGGYHSVGVLRDEPTMMLLQFSSTGELLESLLIGYAGSARAAGNPAFADFYADLPHGGETFYDEILDLVWTEEGLWATGEMGIYNAGSSLSTGSSGFTIFFSPDLHPSRYAVHGGRARDTLERIIVTDSGPVATGNTESFHPWPEGTEGEADVSAIASQWLLKLPWEGRVDFHTLSNGAQPDPADGPPEAGTFFIYPRVVSGLLSGLFDINQPERDSYREGEAPITGVGRTLTPTDLTLTPTTLAITFVEASVEEVKALEYVPASAVVDEATYLAYQQIDHGSDADGDGLTAGTEFFFGTDPWVPDEIELDVVSDAPLVLGVPRDPRAAPALPQLFESTDLEAWDPLAPVAFGAYLRDDGREQIELEVPPVAVDETRFLRVDAPD